VFGSIVYLSKNEMYLLDSFEGTRRSNPHSTNPDVNMYRREEVETFVYKKDGTAIQLNSIAYIMNDTKWVKQPSLKYMQACKRNIDQFWNQGETNSVIHVRKGDGTFVYDWNEEDALKPNEYILRYFNVMVRAEPIRMLLSHAGVKFEDRRITKEEWPSIKPSMPNG